MSEEKVIFCQNLVDDMKDIFAHRMSKTSLTNSSMSLIHLSMITLTNLTSQIILDLTVHYLKKESHNNSYLNEYLKVVWDIFNSKDYQDEITEKRNKINE